MIQLPDYLALKSSVIEAGYGEEIEWAAGLQPCKDAKKFAEETSWVILNAGMKEQVARKIWERIWPFLLEGKSSSEAFRHKLKCTAIDYVWKNRVSLFWGYDVAKDKMAYLQSLPHIGPITKFHLARNLGMDACKPDRHLVRIAGAEGPGALCRRLALASGDRIGVVDLVIWRAANLGMV